MDGSKTVNTVTYTVYQNGAATTLTFDKSAAFSTTPGFVKVKADGTDLMAATTAVFDASGITSTNDKDKVTAEVDFNSFFNNTLTVQSGSYKANFQVTADTKVVCLLDNGDVYTLDQLANDNIVDSSKVFVSYTRDANNVLTATAVFVTVVNPHVPA